MYRPQPFAVNIRPVDDAFETQGKLLSLKQLTQQSQLHDERIRASQFERQQAEEAARREAQFREAVGKGARGRDLAAIDPKLASTYEKSVADQRTSDLTASEKAYDFMVKQAKRKAQILSSATDLPSFHRAIEMSAAEGLSTPEEIEQARQLQWSPELAQGLKQQAEKELEYAARVELDIKRATEVHNAALRPHQLAKSEAEAKIAAATAAGKAPLQPKDILAMDAQAEDRRIRVSEGEKNRGVQMRGQNMTDARGRVTNQQGGTQVEKTLRDDYNKAAQPFVTVRDAYGRVQESLASQDAMSDIALIFGYMKMLDPGSVVRETEFATAQNAAGIPERIRNMFNKAREGTRLSGAQRGEIKLMSDRLYKRAESDHKQIADQYKGIAQRSGANPANVLIDYGTTAPRETGGAPGAPQQQAPASPLSGLSTDELFRRLQQNGR